MINCIGLGQTVVSYTPVSIGTHGQGAKINLQYGPRNGGGEDGRVISDITSLVDDKPSVIEDTIAIIVLGRVSWWWEQEQQD